MKGVPTTNLKTHLRCLESILFMHHSQLLIGSFSFKKLSDFTPVFDDSVRLGNRTYRVWFLKILRKNGKLNSPKLFIQQKIGGVTNPASRYSKAYNYLYTLALARLGMQIAFGRVRRKTSPARWEGPNLRCSHIFGLYYIWVYRNPNRKYSVI